MDTRKVIQEKISFNAYDHIIIYSTLGARNLLIIIWIKFYLFDLVKVIREEKLIQNIYYISVINMYAHFYVI